MRSARTALFFSCPVAPAVAVASVATDGPTCTATAQVFNHFHVLSTLFEDFKRSLAAATEKLQRQTMQLYVLNRAQSRAQQALVIEKMTKLWVGFPCNHDFYARFRAALAELPVDATVRMLLHWSPVNSQHFVRLDR